MHGNYMNDSQEGKVVTLLPKIQQEAGRRRLSKSPALHRIQELEIAVDKLTDIVLRQEEDLRKLSDRQWKILRRLRKIIEDGEAGTEDA